MDTTFTVNTSYKMAGHNTLYGRDPGFYYSLPDYHESVMDAQRKPTVPRPDLFSLISFIGSAVLSSTVLATAIKAWLQYHKTVITIKISGSQKEVTFEGPGLKNSVSEIRAILEAMEHKEGTTPELEVLAERMDTPVITEAEWEASSRYR